MISFKPSVLFEQNSFFDQRDRGENYVYEYRTGPYNCAPSG